MKSRTLALLAANTAAIFGFAAVLAFGGVTPKLYGWDLEIVRAGVRLIFAGGDPYDASAMAHILANKPELARFPFAYPPNVALEVAPLVALPNLVALAVLGAFGVLVLSLIAKKRALWVTASFPALAAFFDGQLVWFAFGAFAATHALLKRDRPFAAGMVASLLAFKPTLLVLVPIAFVVMPTRLRALAGLVAGVALQLLACFAIAPNALLAYPKAASDFSAYVAAHPFFFDSVTWRATFSSNALGALAIAACALGFIAWMWRARRDLDALMSACVLGTLACAWHCLPYDYALIALAFVWIGDRTGEKKSARIASALIAFSWLVLLPGRAHYLALGLFPIALVVTAWWMMVASSRWKATIAR